jgi:hypothetical protein
MSERMPALRTRASTAADMTSYEQTLSKLHPKRLLSGPHLIDVWPQWRQHCEMRVIDPEYKMPVKWNCALCW